MTEQEYLLQLAELESQLEFEKNQLKVLEESIQARKQELEVEEKKLEKEKRDVDVLKRTSLQKIFQMMKGTLYEKTKKEEREYYEAKMRYDEVSHSLAQTRQDFQRCKQSINDITVELKERRAYAKEHFTEFAQTVIRIEAEIVEQQAQGKEIQEAIKAGNSVIRRINMIKARLKEAHDWATVDLYTRGGIFSHMLKYENVDDAQRMLNDLGYYMDRFQAELKDVNRTFHFTLSEYDGRTRAFDFWFDNFFTDYSVRSQIDDDIDKIERLELQVMRTISELKVQSKEIKEKINALKDKL